MINTIFHFVNDPTFDYQTAVNNGDISEYTIVFNSADHSIRCKSSMFGRMSRADMAETLGDISDLIPVATDSTLGGIKIGYISDTDQHSRRYGVVLDSNNKAYVEVPWTDTITPVFDDSQLIQLINQQRQRIDDYITQQTQLISERTLTLFNDTLWVTNNLQQGQFGHWIKETDIEYMRQYGVWDYEYDPSTIVYSAWLYNDAGTTSLGTGKVMFTGNELSGLKEIKITECTDSTLVNTTYYMVSSFAADGESLYQLFTNTFATSGKAIKLQFYSGTPLTDPVTGEPLISIKTSVVQQQADSIYQRVGMVIGDVDAINTWQGNIDNWKNNTAAEKQYVTTAIGNLEQLVGINPQTGAISSVTNLSNQVANVDASTKAVEKAVLASLDLKAQKNSDGTFEAITDLAAFYEDQTGKTLYSGLNNRVKNAEDNIDAESSLMSRVIVKSKDANDNDVYTVQSDIISGVVNSTTFTNGVATATSTLSSTVDGHTSAIATKVSKDSNGVIESSATISADQIYLTGNTFANSIFSGFVKTDTLTAGYATIANLNAATGRITDLEADNVTINNELTAAKATFTGELIGATGSFSGDVQANAFRAGSTTGFNISVESDSINFNYGDTPRAWFSTKKYVESANGPVEDTSATNAGGFYLYMISPATGNLVTIDFANLTFKEITSSGRPTPHRKNLIKLTNGTRTGEVNAETYTVYYTDDDGNGNAAPIAYYSDPALTTPLTNTSLANVYMEEPAKDYYNAEYNIAIVLDNSSYYAKDHVSRYRGVTMSGTNITTSGGYVYYASYGSGSNTYNRYCTPSQTAGTFTNADLANGGGAYRFSGGSTTGTYYLSYASSKTVNTGAMSFFKVNTSGTAMERLQVSAVS